MASDGSCTLICCPKAIAHVALHGQFGTPAGSQPSVAQRPAWHHQIAAAHTLQRQIWRSSYLAPALKHSITQLCGRCMPAWLLRVVTVASPP